jgi:hypothetical protein
MALALPTDAPWPIRVVIEPCLALFAPVHTLHRYPLHLRARRRLVFFSGRRPLLATEAPRRRWSTPKLSLPSSPSRAMLTRALNCVPGLPPSLATGPSRGRSTAVIFNLRTPTSISTTAASPAPEPSPTRCLRGENLAPSFVYSTPSRSPCLHAPPSTAPPPHGASRRGCQSRLPKPLGEFVSLPSSRRA